MVEIFQNCASQVSGWDESELLAKSRAVGLEGTAVMVELGNWPYSSMQEEQGNP